MSDGITLHCPSCGKFTALKKEYDELKIKLKHADDDNWYDTSFPVYTCQDCGKQWAMERMSK